MEIQLASFDLELVPKKEYIFQPGKHNNILPIHYKYYNARHFVRLVLGGELIALRDMFDHAFSLADELHRLHSQSSVLVCLHTDSTSFIDVISKGSRTLKGRLMLDIAAVQEGFKCNDIF